MCGRYSLFSDLEDIAKRFGAHLPETPIVPRYNVAPRQTVPVITSISPERVQYGHWGLPVEGKDGEKDAINVRKESFDGKPYFREILSNHRCLVLSDGFYEWKGEGRRRHPYRVSRRDSKMFAFAGIFQTRIVNGEPMPCFAIITVPADHEMARIHDRMPAILSKHNEKKWLAETNTKTLIKFLESSDDRNLRAYPVSDTVNDPKNDSIELVRALKKEKDPF